MKTEMRDVIAPAQRMTAKIGDNEAELRADVDHRTTRACTPKRKSVR